MTLYPPEERILDALATQTLDPAQALILADLIEAERAESRLYMADFLRRAVEVYAEASLTAVLVDGVPVQTVIRHPDIHQGVRTVVS